MLHLCCFLFILRAKIATKKKTASVPIMNESTLNNLQYIFLCVPWKKEKRIWSNMSEFWRQDFGWRNLYLSKPAFKLSSKRSNNLKILFNMLILVFLCSFINYLDEKLLSPICIGHIMTCFLVNLNLMRISARVDFHSYLHRVVFTHKKCWRAFSFVNHILIACLMCI